MTSSSISGHIVLPCVIMVLGMGGTAAATQELADGIGQETLGWLLQTITAIALAVGGFMFLRIYHAMDRMIDRLDKHETRLSRLEGAARANESK